MISLISLMLVLATQDDSQCSYITILEEITRKMRKHWS